MEDSKIIQAILEGKNEKAIGALYDRSFKKIKDFIKKNSGSIEDAEDIFQDAIVSFYKVVKAGKFNTQYEIDGFLYTICKNSWITKAKKASRISSLPDYFQVEAPEHFQQVFNDVEREKHIIELFEKVGEKCKELLIHIVYFDLSMKEVCEKMGFPNENAAKTQHYKCKQKLIELVGKNEAFKTLLKDVN